MMFIIKSTLKEAMGLTAVAALRKYVLVTIAPAPKLSIRDTNFREKYDEEEI